MDVVVGILDALGLQSADLVGSSVGNVWALLTALDQPDQPDRVRRLALVGATPLLPGTSAPTPFRLGATPGVAGLLDRLMPETSPDLV